MPYAPTKLFSLTFFEKSFPRTLSIAYGLQSRCFVLASARNAYEILETILVRLEPEDLVLAAVVCARWRHVFETSCLIRERLLQWKAGDLVGRRPAFESKLRHESVFFHFDAWYGTLWFRRIPFRRVIVYLPSGRATRRLFVVDDERCTVECGHLDDTNIWKVSVRDPVSKIQKDAWVTRLSDTEPVMWHFLEIFFGEEPISVGTAWFLL